MVFYSRGYTGPKLGDRSPLRFISYILNKTSLLKQNIENIKHKTMTTLLIIAVIAFVISCGSGNRDLQLESDDESGITWDDYGNPIIK